MSLDYSCIKGKNRHMKRENNNQESEHLTPREFVKTIVVAVLLSTLVLQVVRVSKVPSPSMVPTIQVGERLLIYRLVSDIERGDIIVFRPPDTYDTDKELYIKRVIGLPGEKVRIEGGKVYINGVELDEDYVKNTDELSFEEYTIPENEYFVLGDNRAGSFDSRYWNDKTVNIDEVYGKAVFSFSSGLSKLKKPKY